MNIHLYIFLIIFTIANKYDQKLFFMSLKASLISKCSHLSLLLPH